MRDVISSRSNVHAWSDEDLWKADIQLTEAEAAFRIHKSDLSIRPIWHQLMDVVLPTKSGIDIRARCISKLTEHQQILLDHLGLRLPSKIKHTEMS